MIIAGNKSPTVMNGGVTDHVEPDVLSWALVPLDSDKMAATNQSYYPAWDSGK